MASPSSRGSVALVTLGCTRNEVDSEELAGRLAAEGWTLVDDAADADVAVVNTCGFVEQAKKDSIDTLLEAADLKETGRTKAVVAVGCLAERYGQTLADELPDADAVLGFDSYRDMSSHLTAILGGARPAVARALRPAHAAAAVAGRPLGCRGFGRAARSRRRRGLRALAARRPALGAAEDRQRLRPALLVLRHPDVPRVVRLAPADRRHRRGALAGAAGRARAVPRQRELDVVRQGPRRPRAAREAAARADRGRGRRPGARVLPAAGGGAARACSRRWPTSPGVDALVRPVLPARLADRAAPDAPLRRHRAVPRADRAGPRARAARRRAQQRHRRLPRRDRGRRRRARALPRAARASTSSASSATPTRTAPRPRASTASCPTRSSPSGSSGSPRSSRSSPRSGRWSAWASRSWCSSRSTTTTTRRSRSAGPSTRAPTSTASASCAPAATGAMPVVGSFVEGVVVDAVGVDLVVETR